MKTRLFLLYILTLLQINHLQAQTSSADFNLYVGQEVKIDVIDLSNENIYEITSIEFETDDPDHAKYLNFENREIGTEIDFMVTPILYFEGTVTVKLTVWGRYQANGNIKPLRGPLIRTISCIDNPLTISPTSMTLTAGQSASITFSHEKNQYKSAAHLTYTPESGIVTVSEDGIVTAREPGTTRIMVRSNLAREERYCSVTVEPAPVPLIFLSNNTITLNLEEEQTLSYELSLPEGFPQGELTVSWQSTDEDIATVSSLGKVKAKSKGEAKIIARINGYDSADTCTVIVTAYPTSITLDKNSLLMTIGDTKTLKATVLPIGAEYAAIDWTSSDENVASVNEGKVKAEGKGVATITATIHGTNLKATCLVTVSAIVPTSITLDITSMTLRLDEKKKLTATVMPENAEYSISWTSSDKNVATVSSDGMVTAKGYGNATITARIKDTDLKATCQVMVNPILTLKATPPSGYVTQGTTVSLIASDDDAAIWFTTDTSTPSENNGKRYDSPISINSTTTLQAVATHPDYFTSDVLKVLYYIREIAGDVNLDRETNVADVNTIIDVILNSSPSEQSRMLADVNNDGEVSVADINTVIEIIFNPFGPAQRDVSIAVNEEISVAVLNGSGTYTCSSSNTNVTCRMENQYVIIKGIKAGQSVVTITDSRTNAKTTINVTVTANVPESISVSPTTLTLKEGDTSTLTATVSPSDADYTISWTSSKTSVATVVRTGTNTARVTAVGDGDATITASVGGGVKAVCNVTVKTMSLERADTTICVNDTILVAIINGSGKYTCSSSSSTYVGCWIEGENVAITGKVAKTGYNRVTVTDKNTNAQASINVKVFGMSKNEVTINKGETTTIAIINGSGQYSFSYSSTYISFSRDGENITITGLEAGTASFTAIDRVTGLKATIIVEVTEPVTPDPTGITVSPTSLTLTNGQTKQLTATVTPSNATYTIDWTTSNSSVATVSSNGVVTAKGKGTATITATIHGTSLKATCSVTVNIAPTGITVSPASLTLTNGQTKQLTATVTPSNATCTIDWTTSNSSVATVSSSGVVTAKGKGTATITATIHGTSLKATCSVTVNIAPTGISVSPTSVTLEKGETKQLTATVTPSNATYTIDWTTSNSSVATVSSSGVVTAKGKGTATITATIHGTSLKATCSVTVNIAPTAISVSPTSVTLEKGETKQLTATVTPSGATYSIEWETNNLSLATVTKTGDNTAEIKAVGIGTPTITARILGTNLKSTCEVIVLPLTESFTVNGVSFTMVNVEGGTFTMGATAEQGSDSYDDEKPTHQVTLSSYNIGQTEVTQELWEAVMGIDPSYYYDSTKQQPVGRVSWDNCQEFIYKLNQITGKQFRLPTEAEWEFAARGGNESNSYKYAGGNSIQDVAWSQLDNSIVDYQTYRVATKAPNELGIYDMSGNVWEWCQDWYETYSNLAQKDPTGPATGTEKVLRGGCYSSQAKYCRVSGKRNKDNSSSRQAGNGLRLALNMENSSKFGLSETVVTVEVGNSVTVNILNGNGNYTISGGTEYVTSTTSSNKLTVKGNAAGITSIHITNRANNATAVLNVIIKSPTEKFIINGVPFTMVNVEGGTFTMGATAEQGNDIFDWEKPAHVVTLSSYSIGQTEVTQALWKAVMDNNPSNFDSDSYLPVEEVSWNECQKFIYKLNQITGKQFRLPTEAEWEFAARGGNKSQGYKYAGSNTIGDVAWYSGNASNKTHHVATKAPNELGLYDMSGNIEEWCQDYYDINYYTNSPSVDPSGPTTQNSNTCRGGSWIHGARWCRVSCRSSNFPWDSQSTNGLRLALEPENSPRFRFSKPIVTVKVGESEDIEILNAKVPCGIEDIGYYSISGGTENVTIERQYNPKGFKVTGIAPGVTSIYLSSIGATAVLTVIVTD